MADHASADEQLSRLLIDSIRDYAVFALDPAGRVLSWTTPAERLLGYPAQAVLGEPFGRFYTPEDSARDVPAEELRQALAAGRAEQARWYVRRDGSRVWCDGMTTPLVSADGAPCGFAKVLRDHTAVKRAEDVRNDALAYAESVVETVREPLVVLDGRLRVQSANRAFYRTFQVSPQETAGRCLYALGNRQWDIPRLRTLLEQILPERTTFEDFEVEHDFPGIGRKIMRLNARRLRHADAELILLAMEDVTELRRAQAARQALETRFTSLVKNIKDHSIFTLDTEGRVTSWNIAAEHILGYTEAEALGRHFAFIFTPQDQAQGLPGAELHAARERGRAEDERWHLRKGGERFWALGIVSALHDADGRLTGFSKILRDMTERKQAEQALRDSEERLAFALEMSHTGAWDLDLADHTAHRSLEHDHIFGYDQLLPAWTYEMFLEHVVPEDRAMVDSRFRHAVATASDWSFDCRIRRVDGETRWIWAAGRHRPDAPERPRRMAGVVQDITERKQAEAALREHQAQLRALASELSQAEQRERKRIAKILHDHVQQLIVAAHMQVGTLRRDIRPERRSAIAQSVEGILNEALETSRSLAVELSPPILEDAGLIGALQWLVSRMQAQYGLSVQLRAEPAAEPAAEDIRLLLFECVRELLLNTVKHAGVADVEVTLTRTSGTDITLRVRDAGRGFDPDLLAKRRGAATGFGLFSIQERLAYLGGRMVLDTAQGRGTRVTLVIPAPAAKVAAAAPPAGTAAAEATALSNSGRPAPCRVLIVDDHPIMRDGLTRLLELESDIEVVGKACDGPQAIAAAESLAPDVVLMDVNLGEMDGMEATRQILARRPGISVIGLSMHDDQAIADAMREAGAVAYLTKAGQADALIEAIRAHRAAAEPDAGAA
ncbi:PAS domain S-box protein [uncultured Thiohalocapsa sp.]|uniref:PAS domain S-box protein n=1 Tax=uncultured Thiohalocapsa sp. TaxID=768990 RepID=UPI0025FBB82F|nr:PAS domain S-box protein [uncultured Thiohalocapsa sp.]